MSKFHITTREMTALVDLVNRVCTLGKAAEPAQTARWQHWRNKSVRRLHGVYKPSARRYAREAVVEVGASLRERLQALQRVTQAQYEQVQALQGMAAAERARADDLARENEALRRLAQETDASQSQLDQWAQEKAALQEQIAALQTPAKRETPARVTLPARPGRSITIRSAMQRRILQLMGAKGLGRGWRIAEYILAEGLARPGNSVRNAFGKLENKGLVRLYRWHGKPFRWPGRGGGPFSLYMLTGDGRCWYEQVHGAEPVESEIERVIQDHQSPKHGVAILEAHDLLAQRAGYKVDAAPAPILLTGDPWGERIEPDLAVEVQGETWPVEVQVEVSRRQTAKWDKVLRCTERLMLVVLTEQSQANQRQKLYEARQTRRLSPGILRLANLEAMGTPGWQWEDFVLS